MRALVRFLCLWLPPISPRAHFGLSSHRPLRALQLHKNVSALCMQLQYIVYSELDNEYLYLHL